MKKVTCAILLLSASAIGFDLSIAKEQDTSKKAAPIAVNVGVVKAIDIPETVTSVGHIYAIEQVDLSFDNDGKLEDKFFKNGDRVLAGETVAALNDQQNMANLQALEAKLDLAKQTYARVKALEKSGAISKEDIDQKYADLQQAQADVDQQQVVVEHDKLKAPFTGVLGVYKFDVGSYIAAGTAVVQLTQENPLKIRFSIPAELKPKIAIGNEVELTTNTYPNKVFKGKVNYISPTVDSKSGTLVLEAEVANDDYLLSPGMFMSVSQIVKDKKKILAVPDMAIQTNEQGNFVYAVNPDNTVKVVLVKSGIIRGGWTQVISGIKEGVEIVTIGGNKLTPHSYIKVSDIPPPKFEQTLVKKTFNIEDSEKSQPQNSNTSADK